MEKQIDQVTALLQRNKLTAWVVHVFSTKGPTLSAIILIWSCVLLLLSDWPGWWPPLPAPVSAVAQRLGKSFSSGRHFMFDRYQKESPRIPAAQPVTVVAIDEKSLAQIGQWPWPRHRLAALLDAIGAHQPAALGLDIYMPESDQTSPSRVAAALERSHPELARRLHGLPSNDDALAASLRRTPSVLGAAGFDFKTYTTSEGLRTWPIGMVGAPGHESALSRIRDYPAVLASLPQLQSAAAGQAMLSVSLESNVVRRIPLVARVGGEPVAGLAMEMFRVAMGENEIQIHGDGKGVGAVSVSDLLVPTQGEGSVFLHYARQQETLDRYVSALDVLDGKVDPLALRGKLVLIGLTGFGLTDMRTTALGEHVPGIEIQAQLLEALFEQRFLLRPWWMIFVEITGALLVGGLMIWAIPRAMSSNALGVVYRIPKASMLVSLALNAVIVALGFYLFRSRGWLFDAASFFLVTSAVFAMIFAFVQASAARKKEAERQRDIEALIARAQAAEQLSPDAGAFPTEKR